ncbi:hypothetical protein [Caulobacter sp. DWR2-3-1b2]|uniref:hypothetical protein n=1 Tax=unclassified Caulobacter TaxID=2648921 RepID=UPI0019B29F89|nr:hypothetical protein [Caulobacter sp.]
MTDLAYQELASLWEAVFGEQPSVVADSELMARILVTCLPPTEPHSFGADPDEDD